MKKAVQYIKKNLAEFYNEREIQQFTYLILAHLLKASRTDIILGKKEVTKTEKQQLSEIIEELKKKRPIQYILGHTHFYDLRIELLDGVFIPRPETEELVNWIISDCKTPEPSIIDICSGSGCIAISLAKEIKNSKVDAVEINQIAAKAILRNAKINQVVVNVYESDFLNTEDYADYQDKKYDIIVSNPPYVLESIKSKLDDNVIDYEPHNAIFVTDANPLIYYEEVARFASNHLNKDGKLYFEINESLPNETMQIVEKYGFRTQLRKDINGKFRMICATK